LERGGLGWGKKFTTHLGLLYYGQSIGHDIIENAARCELKHKTSTKMTGLDLVIKSLYTADFT
jgi:hypothetical protein